jgi:hypothetical protein
LFKYTDLFIFLIAVYLNILITWGCSSVGERLSGRQEVGGSNPLISTKMFFNPGLRYSLITLAFVLTNSHTRNTYTFTLRNSYDIAFLLKYNIVPEKINRAIKK